MRDELMREIQCLKDERSAGQRDRAHPAVLQESRAYMEQLMVGNDG